MQKKSLWEKLNNRELFGGIVAFLMFGGIKILSMRLPAKVSAYPIFMSNVAFVMSLLLLLRCLYRFFKGTLAPEKMFESTKETTFRYIMTLVLLLAYAVCFKLAGVVLSTFVFVFAFAMLFGEKKGLKAAGKNLVISAGVAAAIYVVFKVLLGIPLPGLFF